ncbi:Retinoic acid induced 16-like protein-domain-containing protein, partial [Jimgerdemannia flammicorona]
MPPQPRKQAPKFLSKFLGAIASTPTRTRPELLKQNWSALQKYYESTAQDPLNDHVDFTPIPTCLENMVRFVKEEEEEAQYSVVNLETGPCLEILLEERILEELVEFAKVDTPHGMRVAAIRFFTSLITNIHAQILPDRAIHVPLNKLVISCHRLIMRHHETAREDGGASDERTAAIHELSLELVRLIRAVFGHFTGSGVPLLDLFLERGWCRGLGESVWRDDSDLARVGNDGEIVVKDPRFDMFQMMMDYIGIPGETGNTAREAVFIALKLLDIDPEFSVYVLEYSGFCEIIADRLSLLFAFLPRNVMTFTLEDDKPVPLARPRRRVRFCTPVVPTPPTTHSRKKRRRKVTPYDTAYPCLVEKMEGQAVAEEFFEVWEFVNTVARLGDKRLTTLLASHLTTAFWHPTVCAALVHPSGDRAAAATAYCNEMLHALTDQTLLEAFLAVLVGEEGGVGADLEPERRRVGRRRPKTEEDSDEESETEEEEEVPFRAVFIGRLATTLGLFDTVLETFNQFALYNLVLRNFVNVTAMDGHVDDDDEDLVQPEDETLEGKLSWWQRQEKKAKRVRRLVERFLSLMPLEDEYEKLSQPPLPSIIAAASFNSAVHGSYGPSDFGHMGFETPAAGQPGGDTNGGGGTSNYDDYFLEAQERHQFALMAKHSWVRPYPPNGAGMWKIGEGFYEGLFLQTMFDQLETMLEQSLERNLMMTSMLSKVASVLDRKIESVLFDWKAEEEDEDRAEGVQMAASGPKAYRRCLFGILEKITQDAQNRAEQVPNFETRLMLARRRGMNGSSGAGAGTFSSFSAVSNLYRQSPFALSSPHTSVTPTAPATPAAVTQTRASTVIRRPASTQSLKLITNFKATPMSASNSSPTKATTPVTLANPFAKLAHFVNAYIVLQEFCKEVAAVVLVKHASGENPGSGAGIFSIGVDGGFGTGFGTPMTDTSRLSSEMAADVAGLGIGTPGGVTPGGMTPGGMTPGRVTPGGGVTI